MTTSVRISVRRSCRFGSFAVRSLDKFLPSTHDVVFFVASMGIGGGGICYDVMVRICPGLECFDCGRDTGCGRTRCLLVHNQLRCAGDSPRPMYSDLAFDDIEQICMEHGRHFDAIFYQ